MPSPSASSAPSAPTVTSDGRARAPRQRAGRGRGSVSPVSAAASRPLGVSRTPCPRTPSGQVAGGRGVEDRPRAGLGRGARARDDRRVGDLEAEQHDVAGPERRRVERARHERRVDARVRSRGDRDLVAPLAVDRDQRDAGRLAVEPGDRADVDALGRELLDRGRAEVVVADRAREPHARAGRAAATAWLAPLPPP